MAKLSSNDILPLIYRYLIEIGMAEVATKIKKSCGFDLESIVNIRFLKIPKIFLRRKGSLRKSFEKFANFT